MWRVTQKEFEFICKMTRAKIKTNETKRNKMKWSTHAIHMAFRATKHLVCTFLCSTRVAFVWHHSSHRGGFIGNCCFFAVASCTRLKVNYFAFILLFRFFFRKTGDILIAVHSVLTINFQFYLWIFRRRLSVLKHKQFCFNQQAWQTKQ